MIQIDDDARSDETKKPWTATAKFASTVGIGETPQEAVIDLLNATDWEKELPGQPDEGRSCSACGTSWTAPTEDCPSCGPDGDRSATTGHTGAVNPDAQELDFASVVLETRLREASESVKSTADLLALYRSTGTWGLAPKADTGSAADTIIEGLAAAAERWDSRPMYMR